jgi:alanine racemase
MDHVLREQRHVHTFPGLSVQGTSASWVEISRSALAHNISQYRQIVGDKRQLAVVIKSNAYGHGLLEVASLCDANIQVDWLCTVNLSEALTLRQAGIKKPILVLSYIDADPELAIMHDIDLVLYDQNLLYELQAHASRLQKIAHVHVKVDTGLSRLGLLPEAAFEMIMFAKSMSAVRVRGMFTHLAESEKMGSEFVAGQIARFHQLRDQLLSHAITVPCLHFSCSAALVSVLDPDYTFGRMGLGLYGLWPSKDNKACARERYPTMTLKPVLTWKTKIVQIKKVSAGNFVGYARTFKTERNSVLALLPVGYWEGYDRKLSNQGVVLVNNQPAPVVGRISMNITIIDITDIAEHGSIMVGQEVVLLGDHPELSAEAIAAKTSTISWEVVTKINPLLPRVLVG